MAYNFQIARDAISENDKNRILAIYLNTNSGVIDWEKATTDFGAKSVDSMKVMTRSIIKKIELAGGKEGVSATTTSPTKGGKKRKIAGDGEVSTPTPKKRGKSSKKAAKAADDEAVDDNDDGEDEAKTELEGQEGAEAGHDGDS